jgi:hypothetical protein
LNILKVPVQQTKLYENSAISKRVRKKVFPVRVVLQVRSIRDAARLYSPPGGDEKYPSEGFCYVIFMSDLKMTHL